MDFNKVIEANKQNIKNIIRLITKEDNEDLEQEVYVKIWKNSDKYQEKGSIKSWISTIARNTSLDYLKSSYHKVFQTSTSEDLVITNIRDKKISPEDTFAKKERQRKRRWLIIISHRLILLIYKSITIVKNIPGNKITK